MSLSDQAERTAFHDASLEACSLEGDSLLLEFQDIAIDWGKGSTTAPPSSSAAFEKLGASMSRSRN